MTETNFGKEMDKMTKEDWMKVADGAIEMQNKVIEASKFALDKFRFSPMSLNHCPITFDIWSHELGFG